MANAKELDPSSSPKAFFGAELRRLREAAGLSQERLGELVFCSGTYIGQIEAATRNPQLDLAERIDAVLNTGGYLARLCPMVTRSRHADYFAAAAELEPMAVTISEYAPTLVPGLLQTEEYARAVIRAADPLALPEQVAERVAARLERARVLGGPTGPEFWCVFHEAVLRLPVGGAPVMRQQLHSVVELVSFGRILVQVLPFTAGAHASTAGMASLMTFVDSPPVVYVEGQHSGQLLDDPVLVAAYRRSLDLVRAVALSPEESLTLIKSTAEEFAR
ncbi:hypothetical protein SRB5_31860 [Streptomyces sp. RB5]|uniref:HTH cro/C1-type domain-containing protein n=1 Tax=Streptomyces smaragdinus TaxID=2585196 RepID=A0A7K0CHZ0_9ACTN|nr:helix-turn-helix transcriptional regulator [Streptomyces smaragdinus]MQY13046.1 hypothetical protein [Streptomyces smaragdinus]